MTDKRVRTVEGVFLELRFSEVLFRTWSGLNKDGPWSLACDSEGSSSSKIDAFSSDHANSVSSASPASSSVRTRLVPGRTIPQRLRRTAMSPRIRYPSPRRVGKIQGSSETPSIRSSGLASVSSSSADGDLVAESISKSRCGWSIPRLRRSTSSTTAFPIRWSEERTKPQSTLVLPGFREPWRRAKRTQPRRFPRAQCLRPTSNYRATKNHQR